MIPIEELKRHPGSPPRFQSVLLMIPIEELKPYQPLRFCCQFPLLMIPIEELKHSPKALSRREIRPFDDTY